MKTKKPEEENLLRLCLALLHKKPTYRFLWVNLRSLNQYQNLNREVSVYFIWNCDANARNLDKAKKSRTGTVPNRTVFLLPTDVPGVRVVEVCMLKVVIPRLSQLGPVIVKLLVIPQLR